MNTKIFPKIAAGIVFLVVIATVFYLKKINAQYNEQSNEPDVPEKEVVIDAACQPQADKNWAYQVNAIIKTTTNNQLIYSSTVNFVLDFSEQSQQVKGLASNIGVQENEQTSQSLPDVLFLAFNESPRYAQFGFFDDLGLSANHPMKLLNPLMKQLSVAAEGESVTYSYDPLAVSYNYTHHFPSVERTDNAQNNVANKWQVTLANDCLIESLQAVEQLPFKFGTTDAVMSYEFDAKRIPSSRSLDALDYAASANGENVWESEVIDGTDFSPDITSSDMMWQAFEDFSNNRNIGQLKKAAVYLMKNYTPEQVSDIFMDENMSESAKRDLAFSLSLAEGEHVQDYILDTLTSMPPQTHAQGEVQKVRLMVALSGRNDVNESSFNRLMSIRNQPTASDNLKNNVLISSGKIAQDLSKKGQSQVLNTFESTVKGQLQTYDDNAASAILASGNAELTSVNQETVNQLNNGTEKSRYAAATVLARDPANHDLLITHLTKEPSLIVFQSTVSGLGNGTLTSVQKARLQELKTQLQQQPQSEENQDKITLLNALIF